MENIRVKNSQDVSLTYYKTLEGCERRGGEGARVIVRPVVDERVALSQQAKLSSSTKGDGTFHTTFEILWIWSIMMGT